MRSMLVLALVVGCGGGNQAPVIMGLEMRTPANQQQIINNPNYTATNGQPRRLLLPQIAPNNATPGGIIVSDARRDAQSHLPEDVAAVTVLALGQGLKVLIDRGFGTGEAALIDRAVLLLDGRIAADWDRVPDIDVLARGIESAIDELSTATG